MNSHVRLAASLCEPAGVTDGGAGVARLSVSSSFTWGGCGEPPCEHPWSCWEGNDLTLALRWSFGYVVLGWILLMLKWVGFFCSVKSWESPAV